MGLESLKGKSLKACLSKLAWGVWYTIYGVREMPEFKEGIFKVRSKEWEIGVRMAARGNFKDSSMNRSLSNSWNIPLSVLLVKPASPILLSPM
jgi:hypothetical protein